MTEIATIAPLKNVVAFSELVEDITSRPKHLPGIGVFNGPSGFGKTFSAQYAANTHRAYYVEVGAFWSVGRFCDAILSETGVVVGRTIADKIEVIIERLAMSSRPLIIDEFDHMATDRKVELVRDIHDKSDASILLIGEERLPEKLRKWERFHNRIMRWVPAEPATLGDAAALAKLYCPGIEISQEVLQDIARVSQLRVRRICTNLEQVRQSAKREGLTTFSPENREFNWFTGEAPMARKF
jgi:DNA transposition AAA+ family ATPase